MLTLFFVGRGIFLSVGLKREIRSKYRAEINFRNYLPFHIFKLYKNVFYYTFVYKDLAIQQFRKKWFLNALYFAVGAIITGILNDMLY